MGRAGGRHEPRRGLLEALSGGEPPGQSQGERREEGIGDERDIPGGRNHVANPPITRQPAPEKPREWQFRRADLAHGVPPDEAGQQFRDPRLTGGQHGAALLEAPPAEKIYPVPVYIVERAGWPRPQAVVDTRRLTLPAAGREPVMICPASESRSLVQVLNEDTSHQARVGRLEDLGYDTYNAVITGGSRLPAGATGYTVFRTQDAVYGTSETSSTVVISVILESEYRSAGS